MAIDYTYDNTVDGVQKDNYVTKNPANTLAILRKINLSVDIATQAELVSAYNDLCAMIGQSGEGWRQADVELSNNLKTWALGDDLSGALHNEITAETDRAETAEEAIRADLSNNYKVTVSDAAEQTSSFVYTVSQGGASVGTINVPKDMFVEGASFHGTVLVLSVRGQDTPISTDLSGLVDEYTGTATDFAAVTVDNANNTIAVNISADVISGAAVDAVVGTNVDTSSDNTVYGAKAYADEVAAQAAADLSVTITGDTLVTADTADGKALTVGASSDLTAAVEKANSALQTIAEDSDYLTVSEKANNSQTISLTTAQVSASGTSDGLAVASDVKAYVDSVVSDKNVDAEGDDYYTLTAADNKVTGAATAKLSAAVKAVEDKEAIWDTLLSSISKGTDGQYVTTTVGAKTDKDQSVAVELTFGELSAGTSGVAKAEEAKAYVDSKITDLSVSATGDTLVSADSTGKAVTVGATPDLTAAVARANASISAIDDFDGQYGNIAFGEVSDGHLSSELNLYVCDDFSSIPPESHLADAATVYDFVTAQEVTIATGSTNGTLSVTKGEETTEVAVAGLDTAAYEAKEAFDKAGDAAALQEGIKTAISSDTAAARFAADAADDYQDIEDIIEDLVAVRRVLGALKGLGVTLTPAV